MIDHGIKEVRRVRHEISEECGHDVDRVVSYYQKVEAELRASGEFRFAEDSTRDDLTPPIATSTTARDAP
jgi:hypothetical protein